MYVKWQKIDMKNIQVELVENLLRLCTDSQSTTRIR